MADATAVLRQPGSGIDFRFRPAESARVSALVWGELYLTQRRNSCHCTGYLPRAGCSRDTAEPCGRTRIHGSGSAGQSVGSGSSRRSLTREGGGRRRVSATTEPIDGGHRFAVHHQVGLRGMQEPVDRGQRSRARDARGDPGPTG